MTSVIPAHERCVEDVDVFISRAKQILFSHWYIPKFVDVDDLISEAYQLFLIKLPVLTKWWNMIGQNYAEKDQYEKSMNYVSSIMTRAFKIHIEMARTPMRLPIRSNIRKLKQSTHHMDVRSSARPPNLKARKALGATITAHEAMLVCPDDNRSEVREQISKLRRAWSILTKKDHRRAQILHSVVVLKLPLREIGKELGISGERVRQLSESAKDQLRSYMIDPGEEPAS